MASTSAASLSKSETPAQRYPVLSCGCAEKVMFKERDEVILKCRIIKIVDGIVWAKCKRCGKWLVVPISLV